MSSSSVALASVATAAEAETTEAAATAEDKAITEDSSQLVVSSRGRRSRGGFFSRGDSSALERFSAAVASAAASVSNTFTHPTAPSRTSCSNADCSDLLEDVNLDEDDLAVAAAAVEEIANPSSSPTRLEASLTEECNAMQLRVPSSGYGGAIPRRPPFSRDSSAESNSSSCTGDNTTTKTCFCGHYTEGPSAPSKRGRCKFCRSRAKYIAGQRSFDASRLFGRRRERGEPRRAASEDQRKNAGSSDQSSATNADEQKTLTMETTSTTSLDTDLQRSTNHRRTWRLRPSVRRQERLELDVPSTSNAMNSETSPSRDHGLRTPPGPPLTLSSTSQQQRASSSSVTGLRRPTTLSNDDFSANSFVLENSQRYATHMMASDMSGLLAPPSRSGALARAHTDPTSSATNYDQPPLTRTTPNSPPPTYEEVMKQVLVFDDSSSTATASSEAFKSESCCSWWTNTAIKQQPQLQPRVAPPSYEEALSSRVVTSLRLGQSNIRSLSEDRATSHPSPPPPFRSGRNSSSGNLRSLTRSSRVEEIPDIYWEQAARELDFCTCRKCQARYRQYFEEDLADPNNADADVMIPMETQVLMQEVLTDGMAFCSLM